MMLSAELAALFARDLARLIQELKAFPDTASVWKTAPGVTNAAGTLALHLEGNLREYIGRQLGQIAFKRDRPLEFSARGVERDELIARLEAVKAQIPPVIAALSDAQLDAVYPEVVAGKPMTTRQFLVHLEGHLNYHLGQIDYLRRITTGKGAIDLAGL
jgi:DinB superfamily